jgi:hypothetical protein
MAGCDAVKKHSNKKSLRKNILEEGLYASLGASKYQGMNIMRAFIGIDDL